MTDAQKWSLYRLGFLVLLILAVYATTLKHDFVWDDSAIIVNNPLMEKLDNVPQFFLSEDAIEESTGYYRPVTYVSFALERAAWGLNPIGYHTTNLVLHVLVVLLFHAVIVAAFRKERLAFVASLIFALHPVAGETVNFLAGGRNTLLSACFGLLSLLFYIRKKPLPALISFTVAIFSKEFALLFPVVFVLYDLRLQREKLRISRYVPFLIPVAGYLTLRSYAVQKANFLDSIKLSDVMTAPYLVVRYVLNMMVPFQLKVLYSVNTSMISGIICLGLLGIVSVAIFYFRKHDEFFFSSCWVLLFLLPVINIIPLHTTLLADRYSYFSLMGFALFLAAVICRLDGRVMTACVMMLCAVYVAIDFRHNSFWKNDIEFFTRMTEDAPKRFIGFKDLGFAYYGKGETARALQSLEAADSKADIPVKYLIGDAYIFWKESRLEMAEKSLLRVVDMNPSNPEPYLLLMMICEQKGDGATAQYYRKRLRSLAGGIDGIIADRAFKLCRTGETYLSKRQYIDAEIYLWQSLRFNPQFIPALIDMGSLRSEQGDFAGAIQYLTKAILLEPLNASAHYNLAMVYKMLGRVVDAEKEMEKFKEAEAIVKQKKGLAPQ